MSYTVNCCQQAHKSKWVISSPKGSFRFAAKSSKGFQILLTSKKFSYLWTVWPKDSCQVPPSIGPSCYPVYNLAHTTPDAHMKAIWKNYEMHHSWESVCRRGISITRFCIVVLGRLRSLVGKWGPSQSAMYPHWPSQTLKQCVKCSEIMWPNIPSFVHVCMSACL